MKKSSRLYPLRQARNSMPNLCRIVSNCVEFRHSMSNLCRICVDIRCRICVEFVSNSSQIRHSMSNLCRIRCRIRYRIRHSISNSTRIRMSNSTSNVEFDSNSTRIRHKFDTNSTQIRHRIRHSIECRTCLRGYATRNSWLKMTGVKIPVQVAHHVEWPLSYIANAWWVICVEFVSFVLENWKSISWFLESFPATQWVEGHTRLKNTSSSIEKKPYRVSNATNSVLKNIHANNCFWAELYKRKTGN